MWRVFSLGLLLVSGVASAGPADVAILFTNSPVTSVGTSVFVVGSIPQLGNWDCTRSTKMVVGSCVQTQCNWSVTIGLPEGTSYEYKFIQRADCATCYSNPANVSWEPDPNRTGSTPAGPPAPFTGKTFFYYSGWSSVSLYYSNNVTGWTNLPMIPIGPGRTNLFAGEKVWRADNVDTAGNPNLQFGFFTVIGGVTNYDNAGLPGTDYQSPLDACVVQDGQVYNYWPPGLVSTNRVETASLTPASIHSPRTIRVYLPRGYSESTTKRYPVLYMHDGQNLFLGMAGLGGSWNADINANNLIRFGRMREAILVGVDKYDPDRLREYTPPSCTPPGSGTSLGAQYTDFLINQVKPYVDAHYRTLTDADNTGVLGSSMGGLISAYLGWSQSATFHKIGCMSSSFWVCYPIPSPDTKPPIRIYLDSGDMDGQGNPGSNDSLLDTMGERDNLVRNGYVFNNELDHTIGYGHWHSEIWWDARSPRCFTFLFPTSDEPNTVLDAAAPPRITGLQLAGSSNTVTWTSYRLRTYAVEGSTNESFSSSMNWSNLVNTTAETNRWNYPSTGVANTFHFLRVREDAVPNWPN